MGMSRLHLEVVDRGDDLELAMVVDGVELADRLDGMGMDPDVVLEMLRGSDQPQRVQLVRCGCGDDSCGAVTAVVRRDADAVVWAEFESSLGDDVPAELRFDPTRYDDELARIDGDRSWEPVERRYARQAMALVDEAVHRALTWRGLTFVDIEPSGPGTVAAHMTCGYGEDGPRWSVYAIHRVGDDPASLLEMLRHWGPTAWPVVYWWGENEQAAFVQPPMAGKRWRMWRPTDF